MFHLSFITKPNLWPGNKETAQFCVYLVREDCFPAEHHSQLRDAEITEIFPPCDPDDRMTQCFKKIPFLIIESRRRMIMRIRDLYVQFVHIYRIGKYTKKFIDVIIRWCVCFKMRHQGGKIQQKQTKKNKYYSFSFLKGFLVRFAIPSCLYIYNENSKFNPIFLFKLAPKNLTQS